jgi:hypothetical protein
MHLAEVFFVPCFRWVCVDKRAIHKPKQHRRVMGCLRVTEQAAARVANAPVGMRVLMAVLGRWSSTCVVICQRRIYTRSYALTRLPECLAPMAVAPRKDRSTRRVERSASEHSDSARNPGTQVQCTKLTNPPKPQCRVERAEQQLRGATRGQKDQGGQVYKWSKGTHHRKGCPRQQRYFKAPGRHPGLSQLARANQSAPAAPRALFCASDLSRPLSHALGQSRIAPPVYPKAFHPVT